MSIKGRRLMAAGVLGAMVGLVTPAFAQHSGGGGGGGHAGGGGGGAHFGGGGGHGPAGHSAPGGVAGHYAAAGGRGYGGGYAAGYGGRGYGGAPGAGVGYHGSAYGGHGAYGYPGGRGAYYHGYSTGAYWGGGYWRGGYWPRAYYGLGYAWFLPILPLAYATYWYSGVPYYYANDVYYTWNPDYSGYTAIDPPPVAGAPGAGADGSAVPPTNLSDSAPQSDAGTQGVPQPGDGQQSAPGQQGQIFMYPKNGQSEAQQSTDKRECQQWATAQAGDGAANSSDYGRAMVACIQGRGYSAN